MIRDAVVHVGTPALRGAVDDVARHAEESLHIDVFRVGDDSVVDAVAALRDRDVTLSVLADTDATTGKLAKALRRQAGDAWRELGTEPRKQHGKAATRDGGVEAFVGTDIADEDAVHRIELGVTFTGAPAQALGRVHAATGSGLADAVDAATGAGVVINDPRTGTRDATRALEWLIDEPGSRMRISTKAFDDADLAQRIVSVVGRAKLDEAAQLLTHGIPKAQRRLLEDAGVVVHVIDEADAERASTALHGTLVDTGNGAFIGSPYLETRVLHGSSGRQSREVGVLLDGDAAAQARAAYDRIAAANS